MARRENPSLLLHTDDPTEAARIRTLFEGEGCQVQVAATQEEVRELLRRDLADVLLCSSRSPDRTFDDYLERLHELPSTAEIPILLIVPWEDREHAAELINAGAADVIYSPYGELELSARIWNHLGLRQARQRLERREQELKRMTERLRAEKEDREKLLGIMAHDLKNPILGITSYLIEMTSHFESYTPQMILKGLIELRTSSFRVRDLLMNLLDWAKAMTRGEHLQLKRVNLIQVVDQVLGVLDFHLSRKRLRLQTQFEVFSFDSDENILSAALRNLLSNAIKFTPAGGSIEVTSAAQGSDVVLEVRDTGVGMDSAYVAEVLSYEAKKFTKGTDGERGTGLGLKLTRDLIAKVGGSLSIRSEPGKGTTVTVTLPQTING